LYIGKTGKKLFLLFVWLFSMLVIAAFADIVAGTFNGFDAQDAQLIEGGSVAMTSVLFIVAAIALGFVFKKFNVNNIASVVLALVLLVVCVWLGMTFPIFLAKNIWLYLVFAYIFAASVTPVWALLQPRDYLNSFLLIAMMLMAFVGVLVANPSMELQAFTGFNVNGNYLFPILFVTVACGAVSGFHSLIASGTSSKQIDNEKHMLPISFGAMLIESFLAVISLVAVGALALGGTMPQGTPPVIFATAISGFLAKIGLSSELSYTLITLAVSAFALTSLDSVARVGRIAFGELFEGTILGNKFISTALTLIFGFALAVGGYQNVWPLFGSANQLLAALALIACAVFLKRTGRAAKMLYVPMIIMLIVTCTALVISIVTILSKGSAMSFPADILQLVIGALLLCLGVVVAFQGINKIRQSAEVQTVKN
jgi:carbon starvation protein